MENYKVDIAIIGSGPAGQKGAIQAAKLGKSTVIIDTEKTLGGNCLHSGTIPSKTLREAILDLTGFYERYFNPEPFLHHHISIEKLMERMHKVLEDEQTMIMRQFKRNHLPVIKGWASFKDAHTLEVRDSSGKIIAEVVSDKILIATGSTPRRPKEVPFDNEVVLDSTTLLSMKKIPTSMVVLGGGVIGAEYASFFAALGVEVTIVDKRDHLLPMLDAEMGTYLQTALSDIGLRFKGNITLEKIERIGNRGRVCFVGGGCIEADVIFYALGRQANVEGLFIEKAGLTLDEKGYIPVNPLFETHVEHIFAAGDVIGGPCLASTSMEQGRLAIRNACGVKSHQFPTLFPFGIYTIPEISSCGYTEEELKKMNYHYDVGHAHYYEIARSHIAGSNVGLFKILYHTETLDILGVHILGRNATEMIHIGQLAMTFNTKLDFFVDQIFNYPTYAEGYRIAALNGLNKH